MKVGRLYWGWGLLGVGLLSLNTWAADRAAFDFFDASMVARLNAEPTVKRSLLRRCNNILTKAPQAVADFSPSSHYTAQGVSEASLKESASLKRDAKNTYDLGMCFAITGDPKYAAGIERVTSAWMTSLEGVHSRQGVATVNFMMPYMILGASALGDRDPAWKRAFSHFLTEKILPLSKADRAKNNHANWGNLLETSIAAFVGDEALLANARKRWESLMTAQINADGELPLELCRTNTNQYCSGPEKGIKGLEYTHYTLLPSTITAYILAQEGQPVWSTVGGEN